MKTTQHISRRCVPHALSLIAIGTPFAATQSYAFDLDGVWISSDDNMRVICWETGSTWPSSVAGAGYDIGEEGFFAISLAESNVSSTDGEKRRLLPLTSVQQGEAGALQVTFGDDPARLWTLQKLSSAASSDYELKERKGSCAEQTDFLSPIFHHFPWETTSEPNGAVAYAAPAPVSVRLSINGSHPRMEQLVAQAREAALQCMSDRLGASLSSGWWELDASILLQNDVVVSVEQRTSWFCGNAYPDETLSFALFHPLTGEDLLLRDFFTPLSFTLADPAFQEIDPAPTLIDLALSKYEASSDSGPCLGVVKSLPSNDWIFAPDPEGLRVSFEVPHVSKGCAIPVHLDLDEIKPFLNGGGKKIWYIE